MAGAIREEAWKKQQEEDGKQREQGTKRDALKRAATKLLMAQALEKQKKPQGALATYKEIVQLFPDSSEAVVARKRIKVLGPNGESNPQPETKK